MVFMLLYQSRAAVPYLGVAPFLVAFPRYGVASIGWYYNMRQSTTAVRRREPSGRVTNRSRGARV